MSGHHTKYIQTKFTSFKIGCRNIRPNIISMNLMDSDMPSICLTIYYPQLLYYSKVAVVYATNILLSHSFLENLQSIGIGDKTLRQQTCQRSMVSRSIENQFATYTHNIALYSFACFGTSKLFLLSSLETIFGKLEEKTKYLHLLFLNNIKFSISYFGNLLYVAK